MGTGLAWNCGGVLQRAQSRDLGRQGSGAEMLEVVMEVDAWDKACDMLANGMTPQQACHETHPNPPLSIPRKRKAKAPLGQEVRA